MMLMMLIRFEVEVGGVTWERGCGRQQEGRISGMRTGLLKARFETYELARVCRTIVGSRWWDRSDRLAVAFVCLYSLLLGCSSPFGSRCGYLICDLGMY